MNWYNFIFSENRTYRLSRHLAFWLLWWVYFTVSYFHYQQTGLENIEFEPLNFPFFIKSILLLSLHIIACYYFIYHLMPAYLFKSRYIKLISQTMILALAVLLSSYFLNKTVFPFIDSVFSYTPAVTNRYILWTSITSGLLSAPKVISAAATIIILKRWWLKQKEKERLEKEKLLTELQLLKSQIHPEFLFSSLDNICRMAERKHTTNAAVLLLKLADILSYILYECDQNLAPLKKEINAIRDYLALEKTRLGNKLELDIAVKGETGEHLIAPLLLFSFIENSFSHLSNKRLQQVWINLEFQIEENEFTMKLIHGKSNELSFESEIKNTIDKALKRLDFFYPEKYELKTTIEPDVMMTYLKIVLGEAETTYENSNQPTQQLSYATV